MGWYVVLGFQSRLFTLDVKRHTIFSITIKISVVLLCMNEFIYSFVSFFLLTFFLIYVLSIFLFLFLFLTSATFIHFSFLLHFFFHIKLMLLKIPVNLSVRRFWFYNKYLLRFSWFSIVCPFINIMIIIKIIIIIMILILAYFA